MLPVETNIKDAYANAGADGEQQFIQDLALFLCVYLKDHGALIEQVWPLTQKKNQFAFTIFPRRKSMSPHLEEYCFSHQLPRIGLGTMKGSLSNHGNL